MKIKRAVSVAVCVALLTLLWFGWPIYEFYAHKGSVSLPPFGWIEITEDASVVQEIHDPEYKEAGDLALDIIAKHRLKIGSASFSAAVSVDGKVVWAGAAGLADLESNSPATTRTMFRIGSTSKALTATALARLVDKGLIDLDAPIATYLADLPNAAWSKITPRQLASHMAGIPDYKENRDWAGLYQTMVLRDHYGDVRDALAVFDGSPLLYEPGSRFHYSTLNFVLLGAVISAAAEKSYREVMRDEVLVPAGMTSTAVAPKRAPRQSALATFYYRQGALYREWRPVDLSHRLPGGGFASTPSDLVRLGARWLDEDYILSATREAFWTPQTLSNGKVNHQEYALGWRSGEWNVEGIGPVRHANHGGVSRGSQSWLQVFPDYNLSIAFNINVKTEEFHDFAHINEDLFRVFANAIASNN